MAKKKETPPDLRQEIAKRAQQPEIVANIADAIIREASGGYQSKGGAPTLKAFEMVLGILDQDGQGGAVSPDYSRMTDDRLRALLASLEES